MIGNRGSIGRVWMGTGFVALLSGAALAQAPEGGYTSALDQFFWSGGGIVIYVQFPLSIIMVALAVQLALMLRRTTICPMEVRQQVQSMIEQRQYREILEFTAAEPSMFSYVVHSALSAATGGAVAMRKALDEAVEERTTKFLRRVEYMNMIGAISPMLGLFGTTYGIILALNELVLARGTPEPAQLANAIAIALVCTFWGLMTAIPALAMFAIFRNRTDGLAAECALAAEEMLGSIQPAGKAPAAPTGPKAPPSKTEPPAGQSGVRPPIAKRLDDNS